MQVFLPYTKNLEKSAQSLDDTRLSKQIVELCQILTAQYNLRYSQNAVVGYANHPVVQQYNTDSGISFLLRYGAALCVEYQFRTGKMHQGSFTLAGLKAEYSTLGMSNTDEYSPAYIKGQRGKDQMITAENVSALYQKLLSQKWHNENPKWTGRQPPEFYQQK
ncbi:MAG TPA: pyrimidine dimer DNA glycosylase/endonuclease V [Oscillospiraceae bacterium]|nr:pyrimidine dimer DNA glycosylase/endonuclease V [Oscillospiraceae bacterium]